MHSMVASRIRGKTMDETADKYRAPALEKGLDIIELLANQSDGMTQGDVAKALDRSSSEIYRMLSTLVRRGYVIRSTNGDLYSLSLKLFSVSQRHPPIGRMIEHALPLMRELAQKTWQSSHMAMESNGDIVIVATAESPGNWGLALKTGTVVGLNNTGSGRVLAAFRSDEEIEHLLRLHRPALGEPKFDPDAFWDHVNRVRKLGYEKMPSGSAVGVTNIAFPIFDSFGRAVAVLSCPYLARVDDLKVATIDEVLDIYRDMAKKLTEYIAGK